MNILYLAHRLPYPPNKGDKIRSFNTIKHLSRRHDVWCACFVDDPDDSRHVAGLRQYCQEVIALPLHRRRAALRAVLDLAGNGSATEAFYRDHSMARAVHTLSHRVRFDAVLVFSSSMGQYADCVSAPRKVIDLCDLDSRKWADCARRCAPPRSWLYAAEARRLGTLERRLHQRFDATVLVGEHEAHGWDIPDRDRLCFVGNGVELPSLPARGGYDGGVVGFVGDMSYFPNEDAVRWFAGKVWPEVRRGVASARFDIVGRRPSRAVRRLERIDGVRVVGQVQDVVEHLTRFQLVVAPLRIARGIQNKVLEAMAAARAVVTSTPAACGIDADDGRHFVIADESNVLALRIIRLLRDPLACRAMGQRAREFVATHHDWQQQLASLEEALSGARESVPVVDAPPIAATT